MNPYRFAAPVLALLLAIVLLPQVVLGQCLNPRFTSCPEAMIVYQCDAGDGPVSIVNYPTPLAVDDCGPAHAYLNSGPPSGVSLPVGTYDVHWKTLEDENGHSDDCFFQIKVIWRPTIVCPPDTTVRACSPGIARVNYPIPTAFDDCGAIPVHPIEGPSPGGFFPVGTTRVVWGTLNEDANDATVECSFYVTVEWPRTVICTEDTLITICPGPSGVSVNYTVPQAFDDCGPVEFELLDGPPPGGFFPLGSTTVIYKTPEDSEGNYQSCNFHVRVNAQDDDPPTITCPGDISAVPDAGQTSATVTYAVDAVDDCPGAVTVECNPPSGSVFPCGTTLVTCTATDANQNVSQCTFSVSVGIPVSVDVRPGFCPNPFKTSEQGVVPVAIYGTRLFDVTQIDPASVKLEGVSPVRWSLQDVGASSEPYTGKDDCLDCATTKKDKIRDLTLKFDAVLLAEALGTVIQGECRVVHLTGLLTSGCPIVGEDVLKILTLSEGESLEPVTAPPAVVPSILSATHPNPFSPGHRIEYSLPRSGPTRLVIYDVLGRIVTVLVDREQTAGAYSTAWDGRDQNGARATSGLYFYVLTAPSEDGTATLSQKRKLVLSR